jgi:hypothetical protein
VKSSTARATPYDQESALSQGAVPAPDYVMSRYADGRVASKYGELQWDWTPYSSHGRRGILNFKFWGCADTAQPTRELLLSEMQFIMYLIIRRRPGATLSEKTLHRYIDGLRHMARFCEQNALRIRDVLTDKGHLLSYVLERPTKHTTIHTKNLLSILGAIGAKELGYEVLGDQMITTLRQRVQEYFAPARQHPPIPTRIYSQIICVLMRELTEFESVAETYLGLMEECISNPLLGRGRSSQRKAAARLDIALVRPKIRFSELLARQELTDYFRAKGLSPNVRGLLRGLARISIVARLVIHVFTGMRDEEASALQYSCLQTTRRCGKDHFVLVGTTTKLNHGRAKTVTWVTSQEAARAVKVARRITNLCYRAFSKQSDPALPTPDTVPLFAAVSYTGCGHRSIRSEGRMLPGRLAHWSRFPELRSLLQPIVEEADLRELEQIDPHRAWRSEPQFQLGVPWTLTSHQLRRSLALYAQRSGLVSLPSLRRQLQHITDEMSRYYARGSAFAKNLIGDNKHHFGYDWQDAQPVSAAMSYLKNVLLTDEVLFGAHGNWVENRLRDPRDTVIVGREATLRRFKKGELAYRETSLGGCANTETCDKLPIGWLNIECIKGCRHFVGRLPKLERAITIQAELIKSIEPTSAEFRVENDDLNVLIKARDKVRQRIKEIA